MNKRRFYFLEPSKVGSQHITLIEGYLSALTSSQLLMENYEIIFCASKRTIGVLPETLVSKLRCSVVPVMNPEKRRLVLKTLVELFAVIRFLVKLRPGDILFVSCVLPTTLWLLEMLNSFLKKPGIYVVLHGEIEGLFVKSPQSFFRLGFWAVRWLRIRKQKSLIKFVVLDDFIRDKLVQMFPEKLGGNAVSVIHHPISVNCIEKENEQQNLSVCFIGYRTRFKGYDSFITLAKKNTYVNFTAIGGGKIENVSTGAIKLLNNKDAFLKEISRCSAALFPYTSGYSCSLSAAALDALSTGVYIIALDEPFFRSLATYFGSETVKICSSIDEVELELTRDKLLCDEKNRVKRLKQISSSKYGADAVKVSFEKLAENNVLL